MGRAFAMSLYIRAPRKLPSCFPFRVGAFSSGGCLYRRIRRLDCLSRLDSVDTLAGTDAWRNTANTGWKLSAVEILARSASGIFRSARWNQRHCSRCNRRACGLVPRFKFRAATALVCFLAGVRSPLPTDLEFTGNVDLAGCYAYFPNESDSCFFRPSDDSSAPGRHLRCTHEQSPDGSAR
jgi:hypothetical protein